MAMEEILKAILSGAAQAQAQPRGGQQASDPMMDMIGAILGGGSAPSRQAAPPSLEDLIQGISSGDARQAAGVTPGGGMGGLLEAILGGGAGGAAPQRGQAQPAGGLGDILGAILGGGSSGGSGMGSNAFLAPIANALAEKLNLPPAVAQMIVAFLVEKLFSGAGAPAPAAAPSGTRSRRAAAPAQPQGMDLDHLLDEMAEGKQVDATYFRQSGMAQELAQKTGLDQRAAERSLQEAFSLLGGQLQAERQPRPSNQTARSGLDHLLDTWK